MKNRKIIVIGNDLDLIDQMNLIDLNIGVIDKKKIDESYYLGEDKKFLNDNFKNSKFIISLDNPLKKKKYF